MLGTSKYYKLSVIFSDTKEVRNVYYVDGIVFEKDHICLQGGMLSLEEPIVFYALRLCNERNIRATQTGDFIPNFQTESAVYFDAVDKITLVGVDDSENILFEKNYLGKEEGKTHEH